MWPDSRARRRTPSPTQHARTEQSTEQASQADSQGVPDGDESYIGASQAAKDIYPLTDVVLDDGWAPTAQIAIGYARKTDAAFDSRVAMEIVTANGVELEGDSAPLGLEYTYRPTASDYLDNVGQIGLRKGKDKMQSLMLTLYVTFDPNAVTNGSIRGRDRN